LAKALAFARTETERWLQPTTKINFKLKVQKIFPYCSWLQPTETEKKKELKGL
jgi:hypothetical protein